MLVARGKAWREEDKLGRATILVARLEDIMTGR
jgi:hypothetical protein